MTRVTVIVSLWLLLVGSISDSVVSGTSHRSPLELLALYAAVTAAALAGVWVHLSGDPDAEPRPGPGRDPWHYD